METNDMHQPVLLNEVTELLVTDKSGIYIDATLGLAGHSIKFLSVLNERARVFGMDWDPEMAALAAKNLAPYGERAKVIQGDFANIDEILTREQLSGVTGILFDLGISSLHFDKPSRGFSLKHEGPLDMRISPGNPLTAYNIVNHWPYEQIEHLVRVCGERRSGRIARAIMAQRAVKPLETTAELRNLIEQVVPFKGEKNHPATTTFLALRIAVHCEFDKARALLEHLWHHFTDDLDRFYERYWPSALKDGEPIDDVRDFVAGMTDAFAVNLHERIFTPRRWYLY